MQLFRSATSSLRQNFALLLVSTSPLLSLSNVAASKTPQRAFTVSSSKMSSSDASSDYVAGDLSAQTSQRIQDAHDLFGARPSHSIFKRSWSPDAIFEDPICYATGERQYKAQWWGMPAAFSKSELLSWHVEKDDPREIRYVSVCSQPEGKQVWFHWQCNLSESPRVGPEAAVHCQGLRCEKGNVGR
jgi:hypothetical protein